MTVSKYRSLALRRRALPLEEGEGHDSRDGGGTSPWMDEVERSRMPEPRTASGTAVEGGGVDKQRIGEAPECVVDFRTPIQWSVVGLQVGNLIVEPYDQAVETLGFDHGAVVGALQRQIAYALGNDIDDAPLADCLTQQIVQ